MSTYIGALIGAVASLMFITAAYSYECRTKTITPPDGGMVICTECCDTLGNCTVTCF